VAALAALSAVWLHRGIAAPSRASLASRAELGQAFVPRPEVARLASLGFRTLMADAYWLQAVQIVGQAAVPAAYGEVLGRYIDVVTTVDPWVDHPYRFAAVWLTGNETDVRQADRLLRRSFQYHPDDWRNHFYLGFNLFHYLGEDQPAADQLAVAARLPGSPAYLMGLAARLRAGHAGLEVSERMILEMRHATQDEKRRAGYDEMLREIETERRARFLDRARAEYQKRSGHDIGRVEDLVRGPEPVLRRLPPEPNHAGWVLDAETGKIVSGHYHHRYRVYSQASKHPGA